MDQDGEGEDSGNEQPEIDAGVVGMDIDNAESEDDDFLGERDLGAEMNWEEQRLAIVNVDRVAGLPPAPLNQVRRHRMILRVDDEEEEDEENSSDPREDDDASSTSSDNNSDREAFDTNLPTQHSYLGDARQLAGRTILEEDLIQDLPIISRPGMILMPGQTLPMNFYRQTEHSLIRRLIHSTKTFGVLYCRYCTTYPGVIDEANIGTTAEIYEFREPPPDSLEVGLKIKAKGRQRFKILSKRRQVDGTKIATVEILAEIELPDLLHNVRLLSRDRLKHCRRPSDDDDDDDDKVSTSESEGNPAEVKRPHDKAKEGENEAKFMPASVSYKLSKFNHWRTPVYNVPLTPFPTWVHEMYDGNILAERVHEMLGKLRMFFQTQVVVPKDPKELSFWIAANLPLDDIHKQDLLELNCVNQRLRLEISIMEKCHILCCRNCNEEIGKQEDIFSMSSEGPQGAYVNPSGYIHETLTLFRVTNLVLVGESSTEYSWFPGYAWTVCQCTYCESHLGWKFTATSRNMTPKKFWGISRRSIRPQLDVVDDNDAQNNLPPP